MYTYILHILHVRFYSAEIEALLRDNLIFNPDYMLLGFIFSFVFRSSKLSNKKIRFVNYDLRWAAVGVRSFYKKITNCSNAE